MRYILFERSNNKYQVFIVRLHYSTLEWRYVAAVFIRIFRDLIGLRWGMKLENSWGGRDLNDKLIFRPFIRLPFLMLALSLSRKTSTAALVGLDGGLPFRFNWL